MVLMKRFCGGCGVVCRLQSHPRKQICNLGDEEDLVQWWLMQARYGGGARGIHSGGGGIIIGTGAVICGVGSQCFLFLLLEFLYDVDTKIHNSWWGWVGGLWRMALSKGHSD